MLFSSLSFIFRFLPAFLLVYLLVPAKAKNLVLFIGSLIFYGLGEPVYVFLMLFAIVFSYLAARGMEHFRQKRRTATLILALCSLFNLSLLLFYKYGAFFVSLFASLTGRVSTYENPALPLGISFYTFQILSYLVDVYRGTMEAEKSLIDLGAYISMFPQLIAGPIVIYSDVKSAIKNAAGRISLDGFAEGAEIFTMGLGSKVLLANRFGQLWDTMAEMGYGSLSASSAWIGALAYTFQIYFDFNGYSLMAVGLGRMLGFQLPGNFDHPYTARSVTDFWKRWHITLTSFFRTYVYIPLGGNRKGRGRTYLNMFIVWCITGFWHGAGWNFILWGLYYFCFLSIERLIRELRSGGGLAAHSGTAAAGNAAQKSGPATDDTAKSGPAAGGAAPLSTAREGLLRVALSHVVTMVIVICGWVLFAVTDLGEAFTYLGRMFSPLVGRGDGLGIMSFGPVMYLWLVLGAVFSTAIPSSLLRKKNSYVLNAIVLIIIFWASVVQLSDGAYNPFLYFRF